MYRSDEINSRLPYAFENELPWLRSIASDVHTAVMIGAGPGVMGMALLEGNPHMSLTIIDIHTCEYARKHLDQAGFPVVGYVVDDSAEYGKDYDGPKLDFLLVDGDHSKTGVKRDVEAWFRHVKEGGLLFFHDYENINDDPDNGVKEALQDLVKQKTLYAEDVDTPGISIVYRKNFYV